MKIKSLGIICAFIFAIILCGAVSATTTVNFSTNGKFINITHTYTPSTLKTSVTTVTKTGTYGYGKYMTYTQSGKDIRGRNTTFMMVYYNNKVKYATGKLVSSEGYVNSKMFFGATSMVITRYGKINSNITFSGNETGPVTYHNGNPIIKTAVGIMKYYMGGKLYATVKSSDLSKYAIDSYGDYNVVNDTITKSTVYANGITRKTVVSTINSYNSMGTQNGMKVSGTSSGTEKINGNIVTYTGKIYIGVKYDSNAREYENGDYKEVLTSSSPTLYKIVPLESFY